MPREMPFGAGFHDWAALELGTWFARAGGGPLRLVGAADRRRRGRDASRLLADASLLVQRSAGIVAEPVLTKPGREGVAEAAAGAEFQRKVRFALVFADFVDLDDVEMLQAGDGLRLRAEASQFRFAGMTAREKDLSELAAKAESAPGGIIVSYTAYRSELTSVRAQKQAAERAFRMHNCDAPKKPDAPKRP